VTSPLLSRPGAVVADPPDAGVAAHYGDPYAEQRALERGAALVDLSHRGVLRISGPDRLSWLHSLLTQHVAALAPGVPTQALVLSPQGHVEHHLHLVDDGEAVLAHVEPGTAPALLAFLDRMRFLLRVEVQDVTAEYAVVADPSPAAAAARELAAYDGPVAGVQAFEALRVASRVPRLGLDTDHRHAAARGRLARHRRAPGQGLLPRAGDGRAGAQPRPAAAPAGAAAPRRLGQRAARAGDPVQLDGRDVGRVGTAVRHHELGPIALALVKRNVPGRRALLAGGVAAQVDPAPEDDVPVSAARQAAAARERLLRLR
jgi:folate-binding Fe-S cluster repair protein YgfZ